MKAGYVLLDGCADRPSPQLNYTTPLKAAYTPNLDRLSMRSRLGKVTTVRRGIAPESDIAVFNMLGYSFEQGYPGRGVIEAVGAGLDFKDGDVALRANLASAKGVRIVDRRAGRDLTQKEADSLAETVMGVELEGAEFQFKATVGYRGVLVIRSRRPLSASISNTDPAYSRVGGFGAAKETSSSDEVAKSLPEDGEAAANAAALVNEFTEKSALALAKSEVNGTRKSQGKLPANCVLLRDAGDHLPVVPSFEEKYGMKGTAIVEMPAEVGIAKILKMRMVPVKDRSDLKEKSRLFNSELREGAVVYVHIKGPDEFGHDGNAPGKRKCIESIDREFFGALQADRGVRLGVSCDHATPCVMKMHSADPVPLLVSSEGKGDAMRFTEDSARKGSLGHLRGRDVLARVLSLRPRTSSAV